MRNYKYLFFLVLLVLAACRNENTVPANVISMERMPVILADVQMVDGDMASTAQVQDSLYKYGIGKYLMVFKKYHTDSARFRKSYLWYTKRPWLLDSISNQVITILQKKSDSLAKVKVPAVKIITPTATTGPTNTVKPVTPANNAISAK